MLDTRILNELLDWLSDLLGTDYRTAQARPSGAGCINETYEIYSQQLDSVWHTLYSVCHASYSVRLALYSVWLA